MYGKSKKSKHSAEALALNVRTGPSNHLTFQICHPELKLLAGLPLSSKALLICSFPLTSCKPTLAALPLFIDIGPKQENVRSPLSRLRASDHRQAAGLRAGEQTEIEESSQREGPPCWTGPRLQLACRSVEILRCRVSGG